MRTIVPRNESRDIQIEVMHMKVKTILFPTDFSDSADHALTQAVELAMAHKAKLHIFHAILLHTEDPRHLEDLLKDYVVQVEKDALGFLEEKSGELRKRGLDVEISTERSVSAFEAIMDKEKALQPDLIVMGTHGRTGLGKILLGSVAEKVLRYAETHVLTLRQDAAIFEQDTLDRILVPVDFTEFSRRAAEVARSLLTKKGSLILAHVVASPIHPSFYAGGVTRLFQLDPELPNRVRASLEKWLGKENGEIVVSEGDVHTEIMKIAEETKAQLIALGTRGLTGVDHFLLGSITEKVVRSAKIPVLTVK